MKGLIKVFIPNRQKDYLPEKDLTVFSLNAYSSFSLNPYNSLLRLFMLISLFMIVTVSSPAHAREEKGVTGKGEAAVVGITPEEGRLIALQRARANAIEKAVGMDILGTTLVTNGRLVGQFIKTFSRGFIIEEENTMTWDFLEDGTPRYTSLITATVVVPEKKKDPLFSLDASLNRPVFIAGEAATITLNVTKEAGYAIFNLRADDRICMLYPQVNTGKAALLSPGRSVMFPEKDSGLTMEMGTLPGHKRDTEAFIVIAVPVKDKAPVRINDIFSAGRLYTVPEFFSVYSSIADNAVDEILPYEVRERQ